MRNFPFSVLFWVILATKIKNTVGRKRWVMWMNSPRPQKMPYFEINFQLTFYKFYFFLVLVLYSASFQNVAYRFSHSSGPLRETIVRLNWVCLNDIKWIRGDAIAKELFPNTSYSLNVYLLCIHPTQEIRENKACVCCFYMDQNSQYTLYITAEL